MEKQPLIIDERATRNIWVDYYHVGCPNAQNSDIPGTHIERVNIAQGDIVPQNFTCPACRKDSAMIRTETILPL